VEALLMTTGLQPDLTLDARDLFCPSPVLKAAEEIGKLAPGQLLRILANDPAAEEDIKRWAKRAGHTLLESRREGRELAFLVRKG
jgi:TusA-related sulfurtransferase